MTKDVTLRASLMVAGGGYVIRGTNSFPVTSRAAVLYAHKNETIDVITSKGRTVPFVNSFRTVHVVKSSHFESLKLAQNYS